MVETMIRLCLLLCVLAPCCQVWRCVQTSFTVDRVLQVIHTHTHTHTGLLQIYTVAIWSLLAIAPLLLCGSSFFFSSSTDSREGGEPQNIHKNPIVGIYCVFGGWAALCIGLTGTDCYNVLGLTLFQSVGRLHRGNNSSAYLVSVKRFPIYTRNSVCLSYCLGHLYFKYNSVFQSLLLHSKKKPGKLDKLLRMAIDQRLQKNGQWQW